MFSNSASRITSAIGDEVVWSTPSSLWSLVSGVSSRSSRGGSFECTIVGWRALSWWYGEQK